VSDDEHQRLMGFDDGRRLSERAGSHFGHGHTFKLDLDPDMGLIVLVDGGTDRGGAIAWLTHADDLGVSVARPDGGLIGYYIDSEGERHDVGEMGPANTE
jgi:hypothetical protein